jgi:endo-1,4-beta-xylanase
MQHALLALAFILAASANAQTLPTQPPAGYNQRSGFPAGTVTRNISYYSTVAGRNLNMIVYTPPGYTTTQKYGLVILYQGWTNVLNDFFTDSKMASNIIADNLIGQGKIKPIILVALDDQFDGQSSDVDGMTIRDAIPFLESQYSLYTDADHRGVYGYSWGGGWAFNLGAENLDWVRHIGPASAAPSKHSDTTLFPNGGAEAKQKMKTLFFGWGTQEGSITTTNRNTRTYLQNNRIPHIAWEVQGGTHTYTYPGVFAPIFWNFLQLADRNGISAGTGNNNGTTIQAESGVAADGVTFDNYQVGFFGTGYANFPSNGGSLTFNSVDGNGGGSKDLAIRYANGGTTARTGLITVNGVVSNITFQPTGSWTTWQTMTVNIVLNDNSTNTIRFASAGQDLGNIDQITVP